MALNKFMHPRNLYKNKKPNFQELALKYPDFRKYVFPDVTGKLFLDFKHPDSLRQLSKTLLEDDFDLKMELPLDRLVPTVPLRLNYIHWLEDVLAASKAGKCIKGIDIGTGSSCIYPILSCKLHDDWTFLATEVDDKNFMFTQKNIETNGMTERIKVKKVNAVDDTILCDAIKDESDTFDFCMCNPPFFADHVEAQAVAKSRSYSRADPKSVCTASFTEKIVEGGEVNFLKRMIKDSMELGDKIRIYSSMIGKKSSLPPLKEELRKLKVPKFATTEFCQGKTMRWGLAWTFDQTVNFPKSLFQESKKERPPLVYQVPRAPTDLDYDVAHISARIKALLTDLKIQHDVTLNQKSLVKMTLVAKENTWSNQRRKRRQKAKEEAQPSKNSFAPTEGTKDGHDDGSDGSEHLKGNSPCEEHISSSKEQKAVPEENENNNHPNIGLDICKKIFNQGSDIVQSQSVEIIAEKCKKRKLPESDKKSEDVDRTFEPVAKRPSLDSEHSDSVVTNADLTSTKGTESIDKKPIEEMVNGYNEHFGDSAEEKVFLKCFLKVKLSTPHVVMEMAWVEGENRESMHQVLQYIKNKMAAATVPLSKR